MSKEINGDKLGEHARVPYEEWEPHSRLGWRAGIFRVRARAQPVGLERKNAARRRQKARKKKGKAKARRRRGLKSKAAKDWREDKRPHHIPEEQEGAVAQMRAGEVAIFKGRMLLDDPPVLHRSPPIAATGEQRLLLVLDPVTE